MPKRPSRLSALNPFRTRKPIPRFGVREDFYLSVLATKTQLPPVAYLVNPEGQGGALEGFGVPLSGSKDKARLVQPMERGTYAIASKDQKTVLKVVVIPKQEAGFDPEPLLHTEVGKALPQEVVTRIKATWTLIQFSFESYDPEVYPSLHLLLDVSQRLAFAAEGVLADPISRVYKLPEEIKTPGPFPVTAQDFVSVGTRPSDGRFHAYTLGLQKFNLPEFEIDDVDAAQTEAASNLLIGLSQTVLDGKKIEKGGSVGSPNAPLVVASGGLDSRFWGQTPVLGVIAEKGATVNEALDAWWGERNR